MGNSTKNSILLKNEALRLGFDFCGIAKAEFLKEEAPRLENWLNQGMHGRMSYMENHFDKRLDPCKLVPGAKSVVTLICNYFPERDLGKNDPLDHPLKIAKYAYGEDYHFVIKRKLKELLAQLENKIGNIQGRVFVDSAPVLERVWAQKSGLGWIGKNSLLLNRSMGSFFFLAEMILDIELEYDGPVKDYCGTCTRCMDACPTDAIPLPYTVDASKCISYLTIELKEEIPQEFEGKMENWVFGCDICQDVCPWNRFSRQHSEPAFNPSQRLQNTLDNGWVDMSKDVFNKIFKNSAVKRTKFEGMQRNIAFIRESSNEK